MPGNEQPAVIFELRPLKRWPHQPAVLLLITKLLSWDLSSAAFLFIKHCPQIIFRPSYHSIRGSKRVHILCACVWVCVCFSCTKVCVHVATLSSSFLKENCWTLTWQQTAGGACLWKRRLKLWRLTTWKIWCGDHLLLSASGQWKQWFMNSLYLFGGLKWGQKHWCHCGEIDIMNYVSSLSCKANWVMWPNQNFPGVEFTW